MMAACQWSRDEKIQFARLIPARFNIILTAASDTSRILPMAMFEYRSVRAARISVVGLERLLVIQNQPTLGVSLSWIPLRLGRTVLDPEQRRNSSLSASLSVIGSKYRPVIFDVT
jgi:hypothetical protein